MILVIEGRSPLDAAPASAGREHECSLQQTLRRMGFYAAREPANRAPGATPARARSDVQPPLRRPR